MGGKFSDSSEQESSDFSEINVTPFVDVVLVLLVIFMVTAPALVKESMGVDLPKASSGVGQESQILGIVISSAGQVFVAGNPMTLELLEGNIKERLKESPDLQVIISADKESKHGDVVAAMDKIKLAGIRRMAFEVKRP